MVFVTKDISQKNETTLTHKMINMLYVLTQVYLNLIRFEESYVQTIISNIQISAADLDLQL